jgi:hypothetical protein
MTNIQTLTTAQWLAYRADQLADHYARGLDLVPQPGCSSCDAANNYVCFDCELIQLEKGKPCNQ